LKAAIAFPPRHAHGAPFDESMLTGESVPLDK
jgi:hypothetical protein